MFVVQWILVTFDNWFVVVVITSHYPKSRVKLESKAVMSKLSLNPVFVMHAGAAWLCCDRCFA